MGVKERRNKEKEELKSKILGTAARIISEKGHEKLTIRDLAEEIEYSPRTVYLYFSNKQNLIEAVIEKGFAYTLSRLKEREQHFADDPEGFLRFLATAHVEMAFSDSHYYRAVISLSLDRMYRAGDNQLEVIAALEKLYGALSGNGDSPGNKDMARYLMNSMRAFTLMLLNQDQEPDREKREKLTLQFVDNLLYGIKGK